MSLLPYFVDNNWQYCLCFLWSFACYQLIHFPVIIVVLGIGVYVDDYQTIPSLFLIEVK